MGKDLSFMTTPADIWNAEERFVNAVVKVFGNDINRKKAVRITYADVLAGQMVTYNRNRKSEGLEPIDIPKKQHVTFTRELLKEYGFISNGTGLYDPMSQR